MNNTKAYLNVIDPKVNPRFKNVLPNANVVKSNLEPTMPKIVTTNTEYRNSSNMLAAKAYQPDTQSDRLQVKSIKGNVKDLSVKPDSHPTNSKLSNLTPVTVTSGIFQA